MLVIKMLKKATNMSVNELADYLGKSRNTITSWEKDEKTIPNTEKEKISERFGFPFEYWNIGLDKDKNYYKKMYSDIKKGYILDSLSNDEDRIDEILKYCDDNIDYNSSECDNHEYEHYKYISSLLDGFDPIDNSKLKEYHFVNVYKKELESLKSVLNEIGKDYQDEKPARNYDFECYFGNIKYWRYKKAKEEKVKPFQIISDCVIEDIIDEFKNGNVRLEGIKNFPYKGIKWNKYYEELVSILEKEPEQFEFNVEINPEDLPFY